MSYLCGRRWRSELCQSPALGLLSAQTVGSLSRTMRLLIHLKVQLYWIHRPRVIDVVRRGTENPCLLFRPLQHHHQQLLVPLLHVAGLFGCCLKASLILNCFCDHMKADGKAGETRPGSAGGVFDVSLSLLVPAGERCSWLTFHAALFILHGNSAAL